tara:strand:- start:1613 stop:1861 length:249 start_codon:yes stop_codon:yes gene_type:complete
MSRQALTYEDLLRDKPDSFCIADVDTPNDIRLWCDQLEYKDGYIVFTVINGAWHGKLYPDGTILVPFTGDRKVVVYPYENRN